jgi:type II secretory pathway pseudopilin PulG
MRRIERLPGKRRGQPAAFTLIELAGVCAVIGILLATIAPVVGFQILQARVGAETSALQNLGAAAQASFESTDLEGTNIAALSGSVPAGVDATNFSPSTSPSYIPATVATNDWFVKIARQLGYSMPAPSQGSPVAGVPAQAAAVLFNSSNNTRFMLIGPNNEASQQRFMIVSLIAAPGQLAVPPLPDPANPQDPADLALFNDTWNTNWSAPGASLPPSWTAALSARQVQDWQGAGASGGRLWQLCVQRIVCPIFSITINNTHPTENCYVYYNFNGAVSGSSASVPANGGTYVLPGVYSGRLIQAYRGTAPPPAAQLFSQFTLRDSNEITLQD